MKPWEQDWKAERVDWSDISPDDPIVSWTIGGHALETCGAVKTASAEVHAEHEAIARLAAAAPAMARALCLSERDAGDRCAGCAQEWWFLTGLKHEDDCALDAALTAAGISPEDREAVRKAGAR